MPEEIKEFRTPLDPNGNHWATLPTLHQSQQVNIPQGGLHRTASQHKPTHADAETGAVRYPAVNGSHPAGWAQESVPAPKQPSKIEIRWTNPVGQAPSSTNASLSMGRRTYSLSKPADSEFKAFSPTSRNTLPSDVSSRIADKYHPGNTKQAPPKIQLHYTAATKLLALLAESDDEYEDVFASRVEPPITKTNKSTPVQALRQKFDKDLDEPKKILAKSLLVRSENPQIHGKPKTVATEKPPEMQLLPRVIYKLARTQTSGTPKNKGASLQEPCSHKHEYAESKPYQPTGFQLPENYSTSSPAGRSSLNTKTNGDFHAQNGRRKAVSFTLPDESDSRSKQTERNDESWRATVPQTHGSFPQMQSKMTFDEWRKRPAYNPDTLRQWASSHPVQASGKIHPKTAPKPRISVRRRLQQDENTSKTIGSSLGQADGVRQQPARLSPTGFTVLVHNSTNYDCGMQGGSDFQPQINLRSGMIQSRDETAKDWLLRVQRNIGTTVPTAEHQRACRSIFLSGLREEYRDRAMDLLPGDLQNLAANLDQGFGNAPEAKPKYYVPASPRPVVRMLR